MRLRSLSETDLERHQLRRAVASLASGRCTCVDCGRTPLTGERIHRLPQGGVACDLCRGRHGTGLPSELVTGTEHGVTVRLRAA